MSTSAYSTEQKLKAIEREIVWRKRVYPRRIEDGKMTKQAAEFQLDIFRAIASDYRQQTERERLL